MDHATEHTVKLFRLTALDREVGKPLLRDISLIQHIMPVLIFALQVRRQLFFVLQTYERQPRAGIVGPAAARFFSSRISSIFSGG